MVPYLPSKLLDPHQPSFWSALILPPVDFLFIGVGLWIYFGALWGSTGSGRKN